MLHVGLRRAGQGQRIPTAVRGQQQQQERQQAAAGRVRRRSSGSAGPLAPSSEWRVVRRAHGGLCQAPRGQGQPALVSALDHPLGDDGLRARRRRAAGAAPAAHGQPGHDQRAQAPGLCFRRPDQAAQGRRSRGPRRLQQRRRAAVAARADGAGLGARAAARGVRVCAWPGDVQLRARARPALARARRAWALRAAARWPPRRLLAARGVVVGRARTPRAARAAAAPGQRGEPSRALHG